MPISGAFGTSMQAMNTQSHVMGQISANIANMNTTSYKQVESHLETSLSGWSSGAGAMYGVDSVDIRRVMVQGNVLSTGNDYDLAINGPGCFVTNSEPDGSGAQLYTRDGSFSTRSVELETDSNGDGTYDEGAVLMTNAGQYLMGYAVTGMDSDGNAVYSDTLSSVQVNSNGIDPAVATTKITLNGNIANRNGSAASYNTSLRMISTNEDGSVGNIHNVPIVFSKTGGADNTWTMEIPTSSSVTAATIDPATLEFDGTGAVVGDGEYTISLSWADGTEDTMLTLDLSNMTQYSDTRDLTVDSMVIDGRVPGRLTSTSFDSNGVLRGSFDNGSTRALYQLPVANFAAPESLKLEGGNVYRETPDSGTVALSTIQDGDRDGTVIVPMSLEGSNVQMEDQFSKMIVTQKAYSMAATVFRTNDEMLQEIRNLKE